ncbi:MAG: hypothetical protein JRF42_06815, partial [Deltaproteobacteria bacterium]|nr:hypothetical protein [Deltaproteobacteria bacterium]
MKRLLPRVCFVLSVSLLVTGVSGGVERGWGRWGTAIAQSTPEFIHVDEIRPGMKGYGLSVFRGTEPERFDVEVIDVLRNFRPNQDLILI